MSEPAWQRGYDLAELKRLTAPFKAADAGIILGAFTGWKERDTAEALSRDALMFPLLPGRDDSYVAALVQRTVRQRQPVKDFTGHVRTHMEPGDVYVERLGVAEGGEEEAEEMLLSLVRTLKDGEALFVAAWVESPGHQAVLTHSPLQRVATKIPASSELLGIYAWRSGEPLDYQPVSEADTWGLRRMSRRIPDLLIERAQAAVDRVPAWADHYSSYNKGHAWSAISLRGYDDDPAFIIKPAEMSKAWKRDNAGILDASVRDTVARKALPELEPLINSVPGIHQRIRLMRLNPGGGELTRHADITDLEAGTDPRKVLRIHIPLRTNPGVRFRSWGLDGQAVERHMDVGELWYLDTRKPHTAINGGETERIHLVVDTYSTPEILAQLGDTGQ